MARLHVQSMCASPGKRIFSSTLFFGPQSYNSEKPLLQRGENQSKDGMYICAVGRMCVHLWFYHVWICLQNNSFNFHSSDCSVLLQSLPSKNPVVVDSSFYSRWWSVYAFLSICFGQTVGEASFNA